MYSSSIFSSWSSGSSDSSPALPPFTLMILMIGSSCYDEGSVEVSDGVWSSDFGLSSDCVWSSDYFGISGESDFGSAGSGTISDSDA